MSNSVTHLVARAPIQTHTAIAKIRIEPTRAVLSATRVVESSFIRASSCNVPSSIGSAPQTHTHTLTEHKPIESR